MGLYYPASKQNQPKRKNTKTRPEYKLVEDRGASAKLELLCYGTASVWSVVSSVGHEKKVLTHSVGGHSLYRQDRYMWPTGVVTSTMN